MLAENCATMYLKVAISSFVIGTANFCYADSEKRPEPVVYAGESGRCYAKSVPLNFDRESGQTDVFIVQKGKDKLVASYNWYANSIYLWCSHWQSHAMQPILVRLGPWPRGEAANNRDLAFALYTNGKMIKKYSTLDVVERANNVWQSISHYNIYKEIKGINSYDGTFSFTRFDDVEMRFNLETGERKK
jgi:hypothetical protein